MQILFINILMDGPPSQSLGVDPPDPAVMRKPPRSKDASVLTPRIYGRVLFSASMIVLGTLFVYIYEFRDGSMSGRDQTMVRSRSIIYAYDSLNPYRRLLASCFSISFRHSRIEAWAAVSSRIACSLSPSRLPSLFNWHLFMYR